MAWREVFDRRSGRLIGVVFDDCAWKQQLVPCCQFRSGVEFEAELKVIAHPEGRFRLTDGTRVDILVMDLLHDCEIAPPGVSPRDPMNCQRECLEKTAGGRFVGESRDQFNGGSCVRFQATQAA